MRNKKIKIAIVSPAFGETGGPEVVTQNLVDALKEKGEVVTLFSPGDWKTKAKHIPTIPQSLWNMKSFTKQTKRVRRNLIISSQIKILNYQKNFDIIHLHSQAYAYCVGINLNIPCVLSFHNMIIAPEFKQIKQAGIHTVSLSKSQKGRFKTDATIWNGLPVKKIKPSFKSGKYLITVGRLADQKGIDIAIQIAKKANKKLLIFGRIGNSEERQKYFKEKIKPFLNKDIVYMKELSHSKLLAYMKNAEALLFTIRRPEVCPMVIQEALASGTPVIGTKINPLPELLRDSSVSFLSNNITELIKVTKNTSIFDRKKCREYAEKHFDSSVMAEKYVGLYKKIYDGLL